MLGSGEEEIKRLTQLRKEYNRRKSAIMDIIESQNYTAEFGCSMPIRCLEASQVKMYDADGKEAICKCGNPATAGITAKDYDVAMCASCLFGLEL